MPTIKTMLQQEKKKSKKKTIEFDKMGLWHEAYKDHKESKKNNQKSKESERGFKTKDFLFDILLNIKIKEKNHKRFH